MIVALKTVEVIGMDHGDIPKLVHFFGPDGAGKSTQVKILVDFLDKKGVRVKKYWVRSPHTLAYILWRLLVKIGFYRSVQNQFGVTIKIPAVDRNRPLQRIWSTIEFFSVLPHVARANFLMSKGYVLIAERYILDTITTIAYFINDITFLNNPLAKILLSFIPKDAVLIFIDADFATVLRRRTPIFFARKKALKNPLRKKSHARVYGYVPDAAVEPKEFIDFQRKAYNMLAKSLGAFKIYSPKLSVGETFDSVLQILKLNQQASRIK